MEDTETQRWREKGEGYAIANFNLVIAIEKESLSLRRRENREQRTENRGLASSSRAMIDDDSASCTRALLHTFTLYVRGLANLPCNKVCSEVKEKGSRFRVPPALTQWHRNRMI